MTDSHKAVADALIAITAEFAQDPGASSIGAGITLQAAAVHALLAIEARLGESAEQQRIANIIAALGTDGEDGLIDIEDQAAAEVYVREHIGGLVNPDPGSEPA